MTNLKNLKCSDNVNRSPIFQKVRFLGQYVKSDRRILLLTGHAVQSYKKTDEVELSALTTFTSIYTYYFRKILEEMGEFEIHMSYFQGENYEGPYYEEMELVEVEHTIGLQNKVFKSRPALFERIRKITKGKVCAIGDHDWHIGPEDILFHAREAQRDPPAPQSRWIGWGGDPTIFYPEKSESILTIFVDGVYYTDTRKDDLTEEILLQIIEKLPGEIEKSNFSGFTLRTIGKDGLTEIRTADDAHAATRGGNPRIPYPELAKEMRRAHIFISGHSESMGLSALEACLSGSYLIVPQIFRKPFIKPDLTRDLHHLYVDVGDEPIDIPWEHVFGELDEEKSVSMAEDKTWHSVIARVVEELYPNLKEQ